MDKRWYVVEFIFSGDRVEKLTVKAETPKGAAEEILNTLRTDAAFSDHIGLKYEVAVFAQIDGRNYKLFNDRGVV